MESLLWDLAQQHQIRNTRGAAEGARRRAADAQRTAESTSERLDRLALITHAMWEILAERLQLSEEELLARIEQIDLRDGRKDGRLASSGTTCGSCNRVSSRRHAHCLYCGADLEPRAF